MKIRATTTHPATAFFTMAATPPTSRRPCGRHPSSSERDGPHMLQRHDRARSVVLVIGGLPRGFARRLRLGHRSDPFVVSDPGKTSPHNLPFARILRDDSLTPPHGLQYKTGCTAWIQTNLRTTTMASCPSTNPHPTSAWC